MGVVFGVGCCWIWIFVVFGFAWFGGFLVWHFVGGVGVFGLGSFRWGGLRFDVFWFVRVDVGFCCLSRVRFGWFAKFRFTALVLAVVVGAFGGASLVLGLFWADVLVCF